MQSPHPLGAQFRRPTRIVALLLTSTMVLGTPQLVSAQSSPPPAPAGEGSGYMTRAELEALAARVERTAAQGGGDQQRAEAAALRARLSQGDFMVGDKILISTASSAGLPEALAEALNATYTVREGKTLRFPNMPDLRLQGVLRSELDQTVNAHLAQYIRNVRVRAEPLMQVLVTGAVQVPGYHSVQPDMRVSEVVMQAGKPTQAADLNKSEVRRQGRVIVGRDSLQAAIRAGATLDAIDFRTGDELVVTERKQRNTWALIGQVVGITSSLVFLIYTIGRN